MGTSSLGCEHAAKDMGWFHESDGFVPMSFFVLFPICV
jgi:hypothetical protein